METNLEQTRRFHEVAGIPIAARPQPISNDRTMLRVRLLEEEALEAQEAMLKGDLLEIAKELADVLAAAYGAALEYGIPLDIVYTEVNRTNLAKAGGPTRPDGKLLKPPGWKPPDLAPILRSA